MATVAGAAINAWLESRKSKHATRFDALSAAVTLEGYALTCADKISDHDLALSSDGCAGSYLSSVPDLPELQVVVGYLHPKKAAVANQLMIFPQEIKQADQYIAFWWDVTTDVGQVRNAAVEQVAIIGLRALDLAKDIRHAFKLPDRNLVFGNFDVRKTLENTVREHATEL